MNSISFKPSKSISKIKNTTNEPIRKCCFGEVAIGQTMGRMGRVRIPTSKLFKSNCTLHTRTDKNTTLVDLERYVRILNPVWKAGLYAMHFPVAPCVPREKSVVEQQRFVRSTRTLGRSEVSISRWAGNFDYLCVSFIELQPAKRGINRSSTEMHLVFR